MRNKLIALVEGEKRADLPDFQVGDSVDVHQRILEGQKERIQVYSGTVIARRGEGVREKKQKVAEASPNGDGVPMAASSKKGAKKAKTEAAAE